MLHIGVINQLKALRKTSVGMFLGNEDGDEVLLPHKYVPETLKVEEEIDVFIYRDSQERLIATTLMPKAELFHFAFLRVNYANEFGAFLDWGLEKDLFVPFAEQATKMQVGRSYVVYVFLDEKSERLVASSKLYRFFETEKIFLEENEEVNLLVYDRMELGYLVVVDNLYRGMIYQNEVFTPLTIKQ
ncbi:MAG: S1 RNA-binding domain-containing protein [Bacteroidia bacterium]